MFRADKSIKTNKGEMPGSLTTEGVIKVLLTANLNNSTNSTSTPTNPSPAPVKSEDKLAITPNYIRLIFSRLTFISKFQKGMPNMILVKVICYVNVRK